MISDLIFEKEIWMTLIADPYCLRTNRSIRPKQTHQEAQAPLAQQYQQTFCCLLLSLHLPLSLIHISLVTIPLNVCTVCLRLCI